MSFALGIILFFLNAFQIMYSQNVLGQSNKSVSKILLSLGYAALFAFFINLSLIYLFGVPNYLVDISNLITAYYWVAVLLLWLATGYIHLKSDPLQHQVEAENVQRKIIMESKKIENKVEEKSKIEQGFDVIYASVEVFKRHPQFLIPIFTVWLIYAPSLLYFIYWFDWSPYTEKQFYGIIFGIIFGYAYLIAFSCTVLLELIEQHELKKKISLITAVAHSFTHNAIKIIPIVFLWAIIWFILGVIKIILSKSRKNDDGNFSYESAAKTLANYRETSFSVALIDAIQKGVRMTVFIMLPAVAWEKENPYMAIKKGLVIFKTHLSEFAKNYAVTFLAEVAIFALPAALFLFVGYLEIQLPNWLWMVVIVYIGFGWSYVIYLEQLFGAELYLWHMKWEKAVEKARRDNTSIPSITDIQRPSVLDEVYEFSEQFEKI
jgi:hypothetical protein